MKSAQIIRMTTLMSRYGVRKGSEIVGKNGNKIKILDFDFGRDRVKVEVVSVDNIAMQSMEIPCMMVIDLCDAVCKN